MGPSIFFHTALWRWRLSTNKPKTFPVTRSWLDAAGRPGPFCPNGLRASHFPLIVKRPRNQSPAYAYTWPAAGSRVFALVPDVVGQDLATAKNHA